MTPLSEAIRVVDSHTEGEPTRVVISGWPQPAGATMEERRDDMKTRFDLFGAPWSASRAATTRSSARCSRLP